MDQFSITQCFDEDAQALIKKSLDSAREEKSVEFNSLHLLDKILEEKNISIRKVLKDNVVSNEEQSSLALETFKDTIKSELTSILS